VVKHAPQLPQPENRKANPPVADETRAQSAATSANPDSRIPNPASDKEKLLLRRAHQTLRRITNDYERRWHFNTSVAAIMELVNELYAQEPLSGEADAVRPEVLREVLELLVLMLGPMAPHIAEELWQKLGHAELLARSAWPAYREDLAAEEQSEIVIQINGRLRGKITVERGLEETELASRALGDERIALLVAGKQIRKTVVVPDKLVNIVLS